MQRRLQGELPLASADIDVMIKGRSGTLGCSQLGELVSCSEQGAKTSLGTRLEMCDGVIRTSVLDFPV